MNRIPPEHKAEIKRQIKDLEGKGIIKPSSSGYSSPIWIVSKKPDSQGNKKWRMVIGFK